MSRATSITTGQPGQQKKSWGPRVLVISLSLVVVGIVGFYVTIFFGIVIGEEFSPDIFKRREFHYYEIPVIRLQVSPIIRNDDTGDLEKHLLREGIISATTRPDKARWDLAKAHRGLGTGRSAIISRGDALILCRYLDARDGEEENLWLQWTKEHNSLAKLVWPVVVKLARQQLYVFIPDILALVQEDIDADELRVAIDETLLAKYIALASCQRKLGRHEEAIELYTEALRHGPDAVIALEGRAQSFLALGKNEEANADRAELVERNKPFD